MPSSLSRPTEASRQPGAYIFRSDNHKKIYTSRILNISSAKTFTLTSSVVSDITLAERAIERLDKQTLIDPKSLSDLLLRAEAVGSSRIEALDVGTWRLLRADAARHLGEQADDEAAEDVLANVQAMTFAMRAGRDDTEITLERLTETHRLLFTAADPASQPRRAHALPPPSETLETLLDDLCAFCNQDLLPTVAQAAIAYAQFATMHPFVADNGRVGRALIHMIFRRRGLASRTTPPISLPLAEQAQEYGDLLAATTGVSSARAAHESIFVWITHFANACRSAVAQAEEFSLRAHLLQSESRRRLGSVRSGSASDLLLKKLAGIPALTVQSAAELAGCSFQAANEAVARLVEARILVHMRIGRRRNRAFEAPNLLNAFATLISSRRAPYM